MTSTINGRLTRRTAISAAAVAALGVATSGAVLAPAAGAQVAPSTLINLAGQVATLVARLDAQADAVATATDAMPFHLNAEQEAAEAERLGLPMLMARQDRAQARLDRVAARLSAMSARTPTEVSTKAKAVAAIIGTDPNFRDAMLERYADLVMSMASDASSLGASA